MNMYVFWVWMVIAPHLWAVLLLSSPGPSSSPAQHQPVARVRSWGSPPSEVTFTSSLCVQYVETSGMGNTKIIIHMCLYLSRSLLRGSRSPCYRTGHEINNLILKFCQLKENRLWESKKSLFKSNISCPRFFNKRNHLHPWFDEEDAFC